MKIGDRVKTVKPEYKPSGWTGDWNESALAKKEFGVFGTIINRSDSHGLAYEVRYEDQTRNFTAWFDPDELKLCSEILSEEILQHEQLAIKLAYLTTTIGQKEKEYQQEYALLRQKQDELEKALKDHRETLKKLAGRV